MAKKAWNRKSDEFLSPQANLTLIEPEFGPWGPYQPPKVGSTWGYFLDFSLNPKLDTFFGQASPNLDPEGLNQPNFGPW